MFGRLGKKGDLEEVTGVGGLVREVRWIGEGMGGGGVR